ncbi:MAG: hypothetical protein KA072_14930 [Thermoanaerobaculaceae bacterium]|nr:hypothetical protein [Thermoanaerobaculaceae bacterium]
MRAWHLDHHAVKAAPRSARSRGARDRAQAVIEQLATRFLQEPGVLFLSEPGNRVVAQDDALAKSIHLVNTRRTPHASCRFHLGRAPARGAASTAGPRFTPANPATTQQPLLL